MQRTIIGSLTIVLLVLAASLAPNQAAHAAWGRLAAVGFEAVGDHACTDGITFRLSDQNPRTYTANHVIVTSTLTLARIADTPLAPIPANPITADLDGFGNYQDYAYSGYYTVPWSTAQTSGFSVTLDFQDPQLHKPEVPVVNCVVANLPAIQVQPGNRVIDAGQTAALNVSAKGSPTLSYQWYQGVSGDITTLVGTDSPSLTTTALITDTDYWVRVSNSWGSVDSNTATAIIATSHVYISFIGK